MAWTIKGLAIAFMALLPVASPVMDPHDELLLGSNAPRLLVHGTVLWSSPTILGVRAESGQTMQFAVSGESEIPSTLAPRDSVTVIYSGVAGDYRVWTVTVLRGGAVVDARFRAQFAGGEAIVGAQPGSEAAS